MGSAVGARGAEREQKRAKTHGEEDDATAMSIDEQNKENVSANVSASDVRATMGNYYRNFYPAEALFKWLSHGNDERHAKADKTYAGKREFCFVLDKENGDGEIFCRYQCFEDAGRFAREVRSKNPARIEFGPVMNAKPAHRHSVKLHSVERELVFDIDMTDYDDVRTCCKDAQICGKCWPLMTIAIKILDAGLRRDFGFKHLLWVYSGRRGVHCWVSDERARKLSDEARAAVAEYFAVVKGQGKSRRVYSINPMHPSVKRAYDDVLKKYWIETYLPEQRILENNAKLDQVLDLLEDQELKDELVDEFNGSKMSSVERWRVIEERVMQARQPKQGVKRNYTLDFALEKIIFWHIYPRVDIEVSKHMNHLLKGPFCVHPKTGRVCVPMDPAKAEFFDPAAVPTVIDLDNGNKTLDEAMRTFNETFWNAAEAENKERLTSLTRAAKAANATGMDF
ncbi:DNA primase small subunit family [Ostreococcus tauri]|uniref:DNA primase n=1 Tax=Ostreococcus tauri TaxID=70448 RepID=A0A1Y5I9Q6_OSTTA|nr:DNA primase small subunit family [Ostreococcus tauri]